MYGKQPTHHPSTARQGKIVRHHRSLFVKQKLPLTPASCDSRFALRQDDVEHHFVFLNNNKKVGSVVCRGSGRLQAMVPPTVVQPTDYPPPLPSPSSSQAYTGPPLKMVIAGKPSSGKGSISPMVSRAYRGVYVASGNLLRSEVGTELYYSKIE